MDELEKRFEKIFVISFVTSLVGEFVVFFKFPNLILFAGMMGVLAFVYCLLLPIASFCMVPYDFGKKFPSREMSGKIAKIIDKVFDWSLGIFFSVMLMSLIFITFNKLIHTANYVKNISLFILTDSVAIVLMLAIVLLRTIIFFQEKRKNLNSEVGS